MTYERWHNIGSAFYHLSRRYSWGMSIIQIKINIDPSVPRATPRAATRLQCDWHQQRSRQPVTRWLRSLKNSNSKQTANAGYQSQIHSQYWISTASTLPILDNNSRHTVNTGDHLQAHSHNWILTSITQPMLDIKAIHRSIPKDTTNDVYHS